MVINGGWVGEYRGHSGELTRDVYGNSLPHFLLSTATSGPFGIGICKVSGLPDVFYYTTPMRFQVFGKSL